MTGKLLAILLWFGGSVLCLRDIQLTVPEGVALGGRATLLCRWALEPGETLYTVKWYHGAQEFFRFVPKEMPNTRVFSQTGIYVDVSRSGSQQVVLRDAARSLAGRYRCEVSADAPYFHTVYKSAVLRVVELPESPPSVQSQRTWLAVGDTLRANCSCDAAEPRANLTWMVNGVEVKGLDIPVMSNQPEKKPFTDVELENANRIIFSPWDVGVAAPSTAEPTQGPALKSEELDSSGVGLKVHNATDEPKSNKTAAFSHLMLRVLPSHFIKGRLNVTCVAQVLVVWAASSSLMLDEVRPQLAPVMGSRNSNAGFHTANSHVTMAILLNAAVYFHW